MTSYVPNSKFKLHHICKFCHTYELQYTNCFFSGQRLIKLSLNSGKFELVKFCSKTEGLDEIAIKINKSKLDPVQNVNYFSVVLDEFLSWDAHVNKLCKKLAQTNGIINNYHNYVLSLHRS